MEMLVTNEMEVILCRAIVLFVLFTDLKSEFFNHPFLEHSRDEVLAIRLKFPNKLPVSSYNHSKITQHQSYDSD